MDTKASNLATKEDLARVKGELSAEASENKAELMKWMFVFWVGQLAASILFFLKK